MFWYDNDYDKVVNDNETKDYEIIDRQYSSDNEEEFWKYAYYVIDL